MGSEIGELNERPSLTVYLDSYYIDFYEVTNLGYASCVNSGICSPPEFQNSNLQNSYYGNPLFDYYPVINISWESAKIFCEWRRARLPTEAEWEKAGRGVDGRTYPWGEGASCLLENLVNCIGDTTQVGSYPDSYSPYGLFDMSGNVWEWTADWYSDNYYATLGLGAVNPQGPEAGIERVIRGGSWADDPYWTRLTVRINFNPQAVDNALGFRCARNP